MICHEYPAPSAITATAITAFMAVWQGHPNCSAVGKQLPAWTNLHYFATGWVAWTRTLNKPISGANYSIEIFALVKRDLPQLSDY